MNARTRADDEGIDSVKNADRQDAIVPGLLIPVGLFPVLNALSGADGSWPAWRIASLGIGATVVIAALVLLVRALVRPESDDDEDGTDGDE